MPSLLPKLPRPSLPKLPHLANIFANNPLHEVIDDAKSTIAGFKSEVSEVASSLRIEGAAEPATEVQETAPQETTVAPPTGVSDAETLKYQQTELADELALLEKHLASGGKILGKNCECIAKHSRLVKRMAIETVPIAARQGVDPTIYSNLSEWAKEVQEIGTLDAVNSGKYADRYPAESGNASKFRKAIESGGSCPTCPQPKRLPQFLKEHKGGAE